MIGITFTDAVWATNLTARADRIVSFRPLVLTVPVFLTLLKIEMLTSQIPKTARWQSLRLRPDDQVL